MRTKWILLALSCACGGSAQGHPAAEPVATLTLPAPPPPTPPPPPRARYEHLQGDNFLTVSFAEARKHPEGARVDAVIRGAPAWRAFSTIDPVRDLDWLVQHDEDMLVQHAVPDAQVDAAIAAVAQPLQVGAPGVKAWRGVINGQDTVFLRAKPHVVRIALAENAETAARDLVAQVWPAPSFHTNEAARVRMVHPAATIPKLPRDISELRAWVDSRLADAGADVYVEADCPDAAAARADADAISELVRQQNSFAVRLVTAGLLDHVEVTTVDAQVHLHASASQQQLDTLISLASSRYAGP